MWAHAPLRLIRGFLLPSSIAPGRGPAFVILGRDMEEDEVPRLEVHVHVYRRSDRRRPLAPKKVTQAKCPECGLGITAYLPNPRRDRTPARDILAQLPCPRCDHEGMVPGAPVALPKAFLR